MSMTINDHSQPIDATADPVGFHRLVMTGAVLLAATWLIGGCSSNSNDLPAVNDVPVLPSTNPGNNSDEPGGAGVELSPIELLLQEVTQAAALPVLKINAKLSSGETLTSDEENCVTGFTAAFGEQLDAVECTTPWFLNNTGLSVDSAAFYTSDACQQSLAAGTIKNCTLEQAQLGFALIWINTGNQPTEVRIAAIQPIAGTRITYNVQNSGRLVLTEASDVTGEFTCVVDIASAAIINTASSGQCQSEIGRTISRLFELRTDG